MPRLKTVLLLTCGTLAGIAGTVALLTRDVEITSWKMIWNSVSGSPGPRAETATVKQHLSVPAGWQIGLYADAVPEARVLRLTEAGDLLVSQPRLGQSTLLGRDANGDGHPDSQSVLMSGLDRPHGVEVSGGFLYVGETGAVGRAPFDVQSGRITGDYTHVITGLPAPQPDCRVFHAGTALSGDTVVTAGGRVLCVTALGDNIRAAQRRAYEAVECIRFAGAQFRQDIGHRAAGHTAGPTQG